MRCSGFMAHYQFVEQVRIVEQVRFVEPESYGFAELTGDEAGSASRMCVTGKTAMAGGHSRVMNSSRFMIVRATVVNAVSWTSSITGSPREAAGSR